MDDELSVCTFNCRSVKSSVGEIQLLCNDHNFVLLQETWLLPNELNFLSSIHSDFYSCGQSAVTLSSGILIGRPYGGTGILYRKNLAPLVQSIDAHDSRISAIIFNSAIGPVLIASIYMPTDYQDLDSLIEYEEVCGKLQCIVSDTNAVHCILAGDFQCNSGSRFFDQLSHLASDCNLTISDIVRLNDTFTYFSDNGNCMSWIDHFLCSSTIDGLIISVSVLNDFVSSDHKPLSVCFKGLASGSQQYTVHTIVGNDPVNKNIFDWDHVSDNNLALYRTSLEAALCDVDLPDCLLSCHDHTCNIHSSLIDTYYQDIMQAINRAMQIAIPAKRCNFSSDYIIPGWNDIVFEKHKAARVAFKDWVAYGKPKFGPVFITMKKTRASFKLAVRYCKQHEDQLRADACASHLANKDPIAFWKEIRTVNNSKATVHVNCIGSANGDTEIVNMWRDHFDRLYHSNHDEISRDLFYSRLDDSDFSDFNVTIFDICEAIRKQKSGKATGLDGIAMEAFIHGGSRLGVHLALLFNCFISHSYLPSALMNSMIVPLVKNKHGDLTSVDNYRAIMISNALSKILETVILNVLDGILSANDAQFGFKRGHSTTLCTDTFRKTIDYYRSRGSHVFVCFVDFTKAFDLVNYWKLFVKLIDLKIPVCIISLLAFWYANQSVCIKWKNIISDYFSIANGTRQGSLLSPCLFNVYISELISHINGSGIGCTCGGKFINILAYADDLVLLAPSWAGLQSLLHLLESFSSNLDMIVNCKKTVCMIYKPTCSSKALHCVFPKFCLRNGEIAFVETFRYLGHLISNDDSDNCDIQREIRNIFIRTN